MDADTIRVTAREQCRTARRTDRLRDMKIGKFAPLLGHLVKVGSVEALGAETANVGVTLVIGKNDHHVRQYIGRKRLARRTQCLAQNQ